MANIKTILSKIGLGAAVAGTTAVSVTVPGTGAVLAPVINAISAKLDPSVKNQFDLAVQSAQDDLTKAEMQAWSQAVTAVNATMQAEANSKSLLDKWRDLIGISAALFFVNNYVLLPYFAKFGLKPIDIPSDAWLFLGAVLGVTAYHLGKVDVVNAGTSGN